MECHKGFERCSVWIGRDKSPWVGQRVNTQNIRCDVLPWLRVMLQNRRPRGKGEKTEGAVISSPHVDWGLMGDYTIYGLGGSG